MGAVSPFLGMLGGGFATPGGMFGAGGSILSSRRFKKNIKKWTKEYGQSINYN
jgi:hypothetical protein